MNRNLPEAWTVFGVPPYRHPPPYPAHAPHMVPLPHLGPVQGQHQGQQGQHQGQQGQQRGQKTNWEKQKEALRQWCDRGSSYDRPRTYDNFYQKTPSNFHPSSKSNTNLTVTDSAISSDDEHDNHLSPSQRRVKRRSKGRRQLQYSRTLTEKDVRHLERHLSMKKTIRKKIMRDLQQAFVDDPEALSKTENVGLDMSVLHFEPQNKGKEQRLLDILRDSDDSGHCSDVKDIQKRQFRSLRTRPKYEDWSCSSSSGDDLRKEELAATKALDEIVVEAEKMQISGDNKKKSFFKQLFARKKK